jgi:SAM-dependent methyltransferase
MKGRWLKRKLKKRGRQFGLVLSNSAKIKKHIDQLDAGAELRVVFGGHWSDNPGWLIMDENDQDITKPLSFATASVDAVFSEHVIEHIPFVASIHFLRELFRILKPGGVLRVVCPMLDTLRDAKLTDERGRRYIETVLNSYFAAEKAALVELGLPGLEASPETFLFNSTFRGYGHQFIWDRQMLANVLRAIGFTEARPVAVGEGRNRDYCIERRRRGIYLGRDWREELPATDVFDPESGVVEAAK